MLDRIRRLGKETALYGVSTVIGRMLNFLLVPLYANILLPAENGVIATLYSYIAFAAVLYGAGMEQAFLRFASEAPADRRPAVFRGAWKATAAGLVLSAVLSTFARPAAELLGFGAERHGLVTLAAGILAADALATVPFAALRLEHRAASFAALKVLNIVLTLLLTLQFVVVGHRGTAGVLEANLIASVVTLALVGMLSRDLWMGGSASTGGIVGELARFGVPLIPAGVAGIALQVVDRPIVRYLTDDTTVGIYQLNYRLGIFMMLAVGMFDFAWRPFFLQHARDADSKPMFARVFTLMTALLAFLFLSVSLFVDDLVRFPVGGRTFFPPVYWDGTAIVPVILLAYAFTGAYVVFLTGVYLEKRTMQVPVIGVTAAVVNIAANLALVPAMGIMGAAIATLIGYSLQAVWMFRVSERLFPVPYEWRRVAIIVVWTSVVYAAVRWWGPSPLSVEGIAGKLAALAVFGAGLWMSGILHDGRLPKGASGA